MAEITAKMVGELRQATGLGIMDCKKALVEAEGDMAKAEEILRVKSGKKVQKLAGRQAAEGVIACEIAGNKAGLVEVNCETDFVAKDAGFVGFANKAAKALVANDVKSVEDLLQCKTEDGETVDEALKAIIAKLGENMSIRRFEKIESSNKLTSYLHGTKIGVIVDYVGDDETGHDMAMQVAACRPICLDQDGVSQERIESERRVAEEQIKQDEEASGKKIPDDIKSKRVEGRVRKFLDEVTLLGQGFIKEDKKKVKQHLSEMKTEVKDFRILVVGEGIEKKVVDYAAEVAAASKL